MRTYGRVTNPNGTKTWVTVQTDATGSNDAIYVTTLAQVLQLSPGESPFYANYGVPFLQSVQTQVPPDLYVARAQQQFSQFFAALSVTRTSSNPPTYAIKATTTSGAIVSSPVPI